MSTELIVVIPALLSLWFVLRHSPQRAFLSVYLPVLLLIPDYFHLSLNGVPDPTFSQCALLPIGIAMCRNALLKGKWKFSALDFALGGYIFWVFISEWHDVDYHAAQNQAFDLILFAVFPYMAGKTLIEPFGLRAAFARRIVWLVFIVSLVSIYEFRMEDSLFRPTLQIFFPDQKSGWTTQIRWGFGRVAGPYGHAILMGGIVAIAVLLQRWLTRSGLWERGFRWLPSLPVSKGALLFAGLVIGSLMTFSRGPWLGLVCGIAFASAGTALKPGRRLVQVAILLAVGGSVLYVAGKSYVAGIDPASTENNEEQGSAAYRAILVGQYMDIAMEKPVWGWGRGRWPVSGGMRSIDNQYLYMTLEQGLVGLIAFGVLLAACVFRLLRKALSPSTDSKDRDFPLTMVGIIVCVAVSISTVFLGAQLYPLLFLFVGWSEGAVVFKSKHQKVTLLSQPAVRFQRIVA